MGLGEFSTSSTASLAETYLKEAFLNLRLSVKSISTHEFDREGGIVEKQTSMMQRDQRESGSAYASDRGTKLGRLDIIFCW